MNGVSQEEKRKDSAIKSLAIIGFIAAIILIVWIAVQVVQLAPGAFSSLASIAESVYGPGKATELTVETNKTVVNTGESIELTWSENSTPGEYTFTYECVPGVSITIDDTILNCEDNHALRGDAALLKVTSAEQRFIDVPYTVTFTDDSPEASAVTKTNRITVVNAAIALGNVAGANDEETEETEIVEDTSKEAADEEITEATETPTTPSVPAPVTQYEYTYVLPESNPYGYTDLKMTYLGVGHIDDGIFVPSGTIDNDTEGALRFSVKNIGSKTSEDWTYRILLPNGQIYRSSTQQELKPNEEAAIILGFPTSDIGVQRIAGEVDTDEDRNNSNNDFEWSVRVTN